MRYLLDAAFVNRDRALLDRIALGLVGLFCVQAVLNYVQAYLLSAAGEQAVAGLRRELFARLLEMPPGFLRRAADGRAHQPAHRPTSGCSRRVLSHQVSEFARQVLALVGGVVLLTWLQPRLTLTALLVAPVVVGTAMVFGRAAPADDDRRAGPGGRGDGGGRGGVLADPDGAELRAGAGRAGALRRADRGERADGASQRAKVRGVFFGMLTFSTFAAIVFVLWQGGLLVLDGELTAGALVGFLLYTITIAASIGALATSFTQLPGGGGRGGAGVRDPGDDARDRGPAQRRCRCRSRCAGGWRFEDVSFRYQSDRSLPWTLREHQPLGVARARSWRWWGLGRRARRRWCRCCRGSGTWTGGGSRSTGMDIRSLRLADLRGAIGIVPQEPALFSGTIRENIAYARPSAAETDVEAAARAAHAHEFIERLPQGYDTLVGERGDQAVAAASASGWPSRARSSRTRRC